MLAPLLLTFLLGGSTYVIYDLFRNSERKYRRFTKALEPLETFDIMLEDDDRRRRMPSYISSGAEEEDEKLYRIRKTAQLVPRYYAGIVKTLPFLSAASVGVSVADYFMDKLRQARLKKELKEKEEEFDNLLNDAISLAEYKYQVKSSSISKQALIGEVVGPVAGGVGKLLGYGFAGYGDALASIIYPGMRHRDIVDAYTAVSLPLSALYAYRAAAAERQQASMGDVARLMMQGRQFDVPQAAAIHTLRRALATKYDKRDIPKQVKEQQIQGTFGSSIEEDPRLAGQRRGRLTIEDILRQAEAESK